MPSSWWITAPSLLKGLGRLFYSRFSRSRHKFWRGEIKALRWHQAQQLRPLDATWWILIKGLLPLTTERNGESVDVRFKRNFFRFLDSLMIDLRFKRALISKLNGGRLAFYSSTTAKNSREFPSNDWNHSSQNVLPLRVGNPMLERGFELISSYEVS